MAEEKKSGPSTGSIIKTGILVGGTALIGYGAWLMVKTLTGDTKAKDATYQTIMTEYMDEVTEYDAFYKDCHDRGSFTTEEQAHLDWMQSNILFKEQQAEAVNHTYLYWLAQDLEKLAKTFGLWIAVPTILTGAFTWYLSKKMKWRSPFSKKPIPPDNPGGPALPPGDGGTPPPIPCPGCDYVASSPDDLKKHIFLHHAAQANPTILASAQQNYQSLNNTTRAMVSCQMSELGLSAPIETTNWGALASNVILGIAVALAITASMGAAAPAAAGLTEAEFMALPAIEMEEVEAGANLWNAWEYNTVRQASRVLVA